MHRSDIDSAVASIAKKVQTKPRLGVILGSGWGLLENALVGGESVSYSGIPGFPLLGVDGHSGRLVCGDLFGCETVVLCGRKHFYEERNHHHMNLPMAVLGALGCDTVLLTNASGAVNPSIAAGSIVMVTDHINLAGISPLSDEPYFTDPFVDLTNAYDAELQTLMRRAAKQAGIVLHEGVYACNAGPHFETPAEVRMAAVLGADLVGMSTVSETILSRRLGMKVAALSIAANAAAGLSGAPLNHSMVQDSAATARADALALLEKFIPMFMEANL